MPFIAVKGVVTVSASKGIITPQTGYGIIAGSASDCIGSRPAVKTVIGSRTVDGHVHRLNISEGEGFVIKGEVEIPVTVAAEVVTEGN